MSMSPGFIAGLTTSGESTGGLNGTFARCEPGTQINPDDADDHRSDSDGTRIMCTRLGWLADSSGWLAGLLCGRLILNEGEGAAVRWCGGVRRTTVAFVNRCEGECDHDQTVVPAGHVVMAHEPCMYDSIV